MAKYKWKVIVKFFLTPEVVANWHESFKYMFEKLWYTNSYFGCVLNCKYFGGECLKHSEKYSPKYHNGSINDTIGSDNQLALIGVLHLPFHVLL